MFQIVHLARVAQDKRLESRMDAAANKKGKVHHSRGDIIPEQVIQPERPYRLLQPPRYDS